MGYVCQERTIWHAKLTQSKCKLPAITFPDTCNNTGNNGLMQTELQYRVLSEFPEVGLKIEAQAMLRAAVRA